LQEQLAGTGTPPKPAAKGAKKANATGGSEDFQMIGKGEKTRTENCPLSSRAGNKKEDVFAKTGLGHAPMETLQTKARLAADSSDEESAAVQQF